MFKNYLITAVRNFIRQRLYSFINIGGLAIGLAICILILLWVNDELSYDTYNENFENIYRVVENQYYAGGEIFPVAVTPTPLSAALVEEFPEITHATRLASWGNTIQSEKEVFEEDGFYYADSSFFEIFTFPFLQGDPNTALRDPHSVVITKSMSEKYFGNENPIGKTLTGIGDVAFKVTGVINDVPENSHVHFDFIAPFDFLEEWGLDMTEWGSNTIYTYILLNDNADYLQVSEKIKDLIKKNNEGSVTDLFLQPLSEIHLYATGKFTADMADMGDIQYVKIFSLIALFILLIGCINFMNLATAKSTNRSKEVGLRKVVGAKRSQLVKQFFGESFLLVLISMFIAIILVELSLPFFNDIAAKELEFSLLQPEILLGMLVILVITSVMSGSYPSLFLSRFTPVKVLKGTFHAGSKGVNFRKILVVVQFTISIFLIIGTIAIHRQLNFIQEKKLGYEEENVLYFPVRGIEFAQRESFRNELVSHPNILSTTYTQQLPTYMVNSSSGWDWQGKEEGEVVLMHHNSVDHDFLGTFKMEMKEGRFFSREFPTDTSSGLVINEEAVKVMRMEKPLGKNIRIGEDTMKIIGVVKNFHFKPIHNKIEPMILHVSPERNFWMCIRVMGSDFSEIMNFVETKFREFAPESAFSIHFLEERLKRSYEKEQSAKTIFGYFTIFAIIIASLGLFGLASYASEQRKKEIGVRKALGASVESLTILLSKDFTKYVLISNLIAWPAAFFMLERWLNNFAYRIDISILFFLYATIISFLIAILTVSYHAIRSSLLNPVDSLRYE